MISYSTGPAVGNFESGLVASLFNVQVSVVSGGVLCVLGVGVYAMLLPGFWSYAGQRLRSPANVPYSAPGSNG